MTTASSYLSYIAILINQCMRNWFNEIGRSFKSGTEKAYGVPELERDLKLIGDRVNDQSIDDSSMAQEILSFLSKHPEQTKDQNFHIYLSRWADTRPAMLKTLSERLGMK